MKRLCSTLFVVALLLLGSQVAAQNAPSYWYIWLPDDSGTLVATNQNVITLYDPIWQPIASRPLISYFDTSIRLRPDGGELLIRDGVWEIWDAKTLETIRELPIDPGAVRPVWSVDGTTITFRDAEERSTTVYDSQTGAVIRPITGMAWHSALDRVWSPDRSLVAVNAFTEIILLDPNSGLEVKRFSVPDQATMYIDTFMWSNDGQQLALSIDRALTTSTQQSTYESDVFLLNVETGSFSALVQGLRDPATYLLWSQQDSELAVISNTEILIFAPQTGDLVSRFALRNGVFSGASYTQYGGQLRVGYSMLFDTGANQASTSDAAQVGISEFNGLIQVIVPVTTLDRFAEIAASCNGPATLTSFDTTVQAANAIATQAQALTVQLTALPSGAIPPGCAADLIAVAQALQAQGEE